jgi:hypothetical protein
MFDHLHILSPFWGLLLRELVCDMPSGALGKLPEMLLTGSEMGLMDREREHSVLDELWARSESQCLMLYGRRRVVLPGAALPLLSESVSARGGAPGDVGGHCRERRLACPTFSAP